MIIRTAVTEFLNPSEQREVRYPGSLETLRVIIQTNQAHIADSSETELASSPWISTVYQHFSGSFPDLVNGGARRISERCKPFWENK